MSGSHQRYARYTRPEEDGPDIGLYMQAVSDDAKAWFEAQKAVTKLEVSEQLGKLSSKVMLVAVVGLIVATALMLWFVALALWFGQLLANNALGFLLAGGVFLVLGGIFFLVWRSVLRDKVTLAVINAMHGED
ncbi:MAG: phage holin family protein [Flavobacteriales bacterium]|nr:phage holin family protein [Flavobacteriales bacterium]HRH70997.1 phage holin family protein [Flavobacteriales bacterium]